jgi:hypothetical protein
MTKPSLTQSIVAHAELVGVPTFVASCIDLLGGADRNEYIDDLRCLTGHAWEPGSNLFNPESWPDYWVRSWGARGLLHVWDDSATSAILVGLSDEHWRPAEMCLKVAARHEVAQAGDGAAILASHELPRVRMQSLRALGIMGDTEHVRVVQHALDDPREDVRRQAERTLRQMRARLDFELRP